MSSDKEVLKALYKIAVDQQKIINKLAQEKGVSPSAGGAEASWEYGFDYIKKDIFLNELRSVVNACNKPDSPCNPKAWEVDESNRAKVVNSNKISTDTKKPLDPNKPMGPKKEDETNEPGYFTVRFSLSPGAGNAAKIKEVLTLLKTKLKYKQFPTDNGGLTEAIKYFAIRTM